jgi:hypothetical protein
MKFRLTDAVPPLRGLPVRPLASSSWCARRVRPSAGQDSLKPPRWSTQTALWSQTRGMLCPDASGYGVRQWRERRTSQAAAPHSLIHGQTYGLCMRFVRSITACGDHVSLIALGEISCMFSGGEGSCCCMMRGDAGPQASCVSFENVS